MLHQPYFDLLFRCSCGNYFIAFHVVTECHKHVICPKCHKELLVDMKVTEILDIEDGNPWLEHLVQDH